MNYIELKNAQRVQYQNMLEAIEQSRTALWDALWAELYRHKSQYNRTCAPRGEHVESGQNEKIMWLKLVRTDDDSPNRATVASVSISNELLAFKAVFNPGKNELPINICAESGMIRLQVNEQTLTTKEIAQLIIDRLFYPELPPTLCFE